jgi:hypothetical protein
MYIQNVVAIPYLRLAVDGGERAVRSDRACGGHAVAGLGPGLGDVVPAGRGGCSSHLRGHNFSTFNFHEGAVTAPLHDDARRPRRAIR